MAMSIGELFVTLKVKTDRSLKKAPGTLKKTGSAASGLGVKVTAMGAAFKAALGPILLVVAALTAIVGIVSKGITAADEQIQSVNRLNIALANQGNLLPGTSQRLQAYANEMQRTTRFGDETILSTAALAASFGANEEQIKQITTASANMAAGMGIDLKAAVNLVGKAFVGETGSLSRYGIIIDKNIPKNQKFAEVMKQLDQRFQGVAKSTTQTLGGAFAQLGNALGDVMESVGILLQSFFSLGGGGVGGIQWVTEMVGKLSSFMRVELVIAIGEAKSVILNFTAAVVDGWISLLEAGGKVIGFFSKDFGEAAAQTVAGLRQITEGMREQAVVITDNAMQLATMGTNMEVTNNQMDPGPIKTVTAASVLAISTLKAWNELQATWRTENALMVDQQLLWSEGMNTTFTSVGEDAQAWGTTVTNVGDVAGQQTDRINAAFARMGVLTRAQSQATEAQLVADLNTIRTSGEDNVEALIIAEQKLADFRAGTSEANVTGATDMFQGISTAASGALSQLASKNKTWGVAMAVVNTAVAVTKALTTLPWPANLISAAGSAAAGAIQIATIKGQNTSGFKFGTPGLDFQPFGAQTPAMLHGNEAVVPQGGGHKLAGEIARSLAPVVGTMRTSTVTPTANRGSGGVGAAAPGMVQTVINIDGREFMKAITPAFEDSTKRGTTRVHETALGSRSKF